MPGCNGKPPYYLTAYGLAVKHGFKGTEEEWLESLKCVPEEVADEIVRIEKKVADDLETVTRAMNHVQECEKSAEESCNEAESAAEQAKVAAETLTTDDTLSIAGRAADAKAVREALKRKAIAGYIDHTGRDLSYTEGSEINVTFIGNIAANDAAVDSFLEQHLSSMDDGKMKFTSLEVESYAGVVPAENYVVTLYRYNERLAYIWLNGMDCSLCRSMVGGEWGEWEFENPPMVVGEEYRTTERYMGKAVYTALIDCGVPSNGAAVAFPFSYSTIFRCSGVLGNSVVLPYTTTGNITEDWQGIGLSIQNGTITINCGGGREGYGNVYCQIWYTKD